jgi:hypothetical protein
MYGLLFTTQIFSSHKPLAVIFLVETDSIHVLIAAYIGSQNKPTFKNMKAIKFGRNYTV